MLGKLASVSAISIRHGGVSKRHPIVVIWWPWVRAGTASRELGLAAGAVECPRPTERGPYCWPPESRELGDAASPSLA